MEIATLGIAADSSQVDRAKTALDALTASSDKTTQAVKKVGDSVDRSVESWKQKAAWVGKNSDQIDIYKLKLAGATDAQLQEVAGAMKAIDAHEKAAKAIEEHQRKLQEFGKVAVEGFKFMAESALAVVAAVEVILFKMAEIKDLADKSGTSSAWLAKFKTDADGSGVSLQQLVTGLDMMQVRLAKGSDTARGAARGLAEIGISIDDFRKMDPGAQFELLAEKMADVTSNGAQIAIMNDIGGRGYANLLPLMKQHAEHLGEQNVLTGAAIDKANEYVTAQKRAASTLAQYVGLIAVEALPVITDLKLAFIDTAKEILGAGDSINKLDNARETMKGFAQAVGAEIARMGDDLINGIKLVNHLRLDLMAFWEVIKHPTNSTAIIAKLDKDLADNDTKYTATLLKNFETRTAIRKDEDQYASDNRHDTTTDHSGYKSADAKDAAAKAAEQEYAQYDKLKEKLREAKAAQDEFIDTGKKQTELEKFQITFLAEVNSSTSKLTEVTKQALYALLGQTTQSWLAADAIRANEKAQKDATKAAEEGIKAMKDAEGPQNKQLKSLDDQIAKMKEANDASEKMNTAEAASLGMDDETRKRYIATIKNQIEVQKQLNDLDKNSPDLSDEAKASRRAEIVKEGERRLQSDLTKIDIDEQRTRQQTALDIGKQFFDDLFHNGESAFKNLGRALKQYFIDLLYQLTLKKWMVNIGAQISTSTGVGGGSPTGMLGGVAQALGFDSSSIAGGALGATGGFGALGAGALTGLGTFGSLSEGAGALSAGASLMSSGSMAGGAGMILGTVMPYVAIGYAIYSMFGQKRGGPKVGGAYNIGGIQIGGGDSSMSAGLQKQAESALDSFNKLVQQLGGTNPGLSFGLGISTDPKGTAPSFVQSNLMQNGHSISSTVNTNVGRDDAAVAAEVQRQLTAAIIDGLHRSNIDSEVLAYFDKMSAGLDDAGKQAALQLLPQIAQLKQAFTGMATVFPYLSQTSLDAKINMAQLAGGIGNLAGLMSGFMSTFFTAGEQMQIVSTQLQSSFAAVGIQADVMNMSMQQYRDMVMQLSQETNTAAGQAAFVSALQASGAFAQMKAQQEAEAERLRQEWEQQQAQAEAEFNRQQSQAKAAYDKQQQEAERAANEAQADYDRRLSQAQSNLENAYHKQRDELNKTVDSLNNWIDSLKNLKDALSTDSALTTLTPTEQYGVARSRFGQLAAQAESGDPKAQQAFEGAARQFLQLSRQQYASGSQYAEDYALVAKTITDLQATAVTQLSDAQKAQAALDNQVAQLIQLNQGVVSVDQGIRELIAVQRTQPAPYVPAPEFQVAQYVAPAYVPPSYVAPTAAPTYTAPVIQSIAPTPAAAGGAGLGTPAATAAAPAAASGSYNLSDPGQMIDYINASANMGNSFAFGLDRVPFDNFPAFLHKDEKVLTSHDATIIRGMPDIARELRAVRESVDKHRSENRQDAGNSIGATMEAATRSAERMADATIRAAMQRSYQRRARTKLA